MKFQVIINQIRVATTNFINDCAGGRTNLLYDQRRWMVCPRSDRILRQAGDPHKGSHQLLKAV